MPEAEEHNEPCARCGSDNTRPQRYDNKVFVWALFLFGIPLPWKGRKWFCFDCRKEFQLDEERAPKAVKGS